MDFVERRFNSLFATGALLYRQKKASNRSAAA